MKFLATYQLYSANVTEIKSGWFNLEAETTAEAHEWAYAQIMAPLLAAPAGRNGVINLDLTVDVVRERPLIAALTEPSPKPGLKLILHSPAWVGLFAAAFTFEEWGWLTAAGMILLTIGAAVVIFVAGAEDLEESMVQWMRTRNRKEKTAATSTEDGEHE